ncbi:MAG: hypothetical protein ABSB79_14845 [Syntrophales bacterium]
MSERKESKGTFIFDGDTKRMHRFLVKSGDGIVGTLYVPKESEAIPEKITLEYQKRLNRNL